MRDSVFPTQVFHFSSGRYADGRQGMFYRLTERRDRFLGIAGIRTDEVKATFPICFMRKPVETILVYGNRMISIESAEKIGQVDTQEIPRQRRAAHSRNLYRRIRSGNGSIFPEFESDAKLIRRRQNHISKTGRIRMIHSHIHIYFS